MARTDSLPNFLKDVADAIREKKGISVEIIAADFDTEIESISGGTPNLQSKNVTVTDNGTQNITADSGYDGLSNVGITANVQPDLETKSITITENTTTTITPTQGKDGLSSVSVTTNVSGGGEDTIIIDLTKLEGESNPYFYYSIIEIKDLNISALTSTRNMFSGYKNLKKIGQLNTLNVENMNTMFSNCEKLETVSILNTSKVKQMNSIFNGCTSLTDTSLDNILQMCINTTSEYTKTKTLAQLGFSATNYPTSRIQALPHYQDFIDAGWTIGY